MQIVTIKEMKFAKWFIRSIWIKLIVVGVANIAIIIWSEKTWFDLLLAFLVNVFTAILLIKFGIDKLSERIKAECEIKEYQDKLGGSYKFWNISTKNRPWVMLYGGAMKKQKNCKKGKFDPDDDSYRPSLYTVFCYSEIRKCLQFITNDINFEIDVKNMWRLQPDEWRSLAEKNVIFIGGKKSLEGVVDKLMAQSAINIFQILEGGSRVFDVKEELLYYSGCKLTSVIESKNAVVDYCYIMRYKTDKNSIYLFNGGYGVGTLAGVKALSAPIFVKDRDSVPDSSLICTIATVKNQNVSIPNPFLNQVECDLWASYDSQVLDKFYEKNEDEVFRKIHSKSEQIHQAGRKVARHGKR